MMEVLGKLRDRKMEAEVVCGLQFQASMWPCDQSIGVILRFADTIGLLG